MIEVANEVNENNIKAMCSIFNIINTNELRRIATCILIEEGWDILQVTHKGTSVVRVSKLQMLTSRFEILRMKEHEKLKDFHAKVMNLVNSRFNLGEPIPKSKVVRKTLRSLLRRFKVKVTYIKGSKV